MLNIENCKRITDNGLKYLCDIRKINIGNCDKITKD